jgi:hypothetical protein
LSQIADFICTTTGQTIPQVIAWAQDELEGFAR